MSINPNPTNRNKEHEVEGEDKDDKMEEDDQAGIPTSPMSGMKKEFKPSPSGRRLPT